MRRRESMKHLLRIPTFRRLALAPVIAAAVAGLIAGATTNAQSADLPIDVTITADTPDPAAYGKLVAYTVNFANFGPNTINDATLILSAKNNEGTFAQVDSAPFVFPADSACSPDLARTTITCSYGHFTPQSKTLTFVFVAPSAGSTLTLTATFRANEVTNDNPNSSHIDTLTKQESTALAAVSDTFNGTYVKPTTGATITTDSDPAKLETEPTYLNSSNKVSTKVTIEGLANPTGLGAAVQELAPVTGTAWSEQVKTAVGNGGPFTPRLALFFRLDASLTGGVLPKKITVTHLLDNGQTATLTVCPSSGPILDAGCISGTVSFKDKDAGFSITSANNGTWKFGGG